MGISHKLHIAKIQSASAVSLSSIIINSGADHWWPLDETSGDFLDRIGTNDFTTYAGSFTRSTTVGSTSRQGISFTGSSLVRATSLTLSNTAFGVMYLVAKNASDGPGNHGCILTATKDVVSDFNGGFVGTCKYNSTDAIYSRVALNSSTAVTYTGSTMSSATAYCVCVTFDKVNMKTYMDGILVDTTAFTSNCSNGTQLIVGSPRTSAASIDYFLGEVSDVIWWDGSQPSTDDISTISELLLS